MKCLFLILFMASSISLSALEDRNMIGYRVLEESEASELLSLGNPQKDQLPSEFNIVVWNLYKGIKKEGLQEVLPLILEKNDIGIFQEYESNDYLRTFFSSMEYFSFTGLTHQVKDNEKTRAGVLIQSKAQALPNSCFSQHSKNRELGLSPKATLVCKFKLENSKELLVINVHALNFQIFNIGAKDGFGFGQAYRNQVSQWEQLIKEHHGPVILAGDFNTWNPMRRRLKRILKMLNNLDDEEGKFQHIKKYHPDYRGSLLKLDHIFYRGLKVIGKPSTGDLKSASDHNPLFVRFRTK